VALFPANKVGGSNQKTGPWAGTGGLWWKKGGQVSNVGDPAKGMSKSMEMESTVGEKKKGGN